MNSHGELPPALVHTLGPRRVTPRSFDLDGRRRLVVASAPTAPRRHVGVLLNAGAAGWPFLTYAAGPRRARSASATWTRRRADVVVVNSRYDILTVLLG